MPPVASQTPVAEQAARRRTFAIISHPDAGKTTLTEQLLVAAGERDQAGSVRARKTQRHTVSDWMALEQRRGISVSSTAVRLERGDTVFNLIDTPGHEDFGQDTFRALAAVDAVVMVLDATRGVEERTRQLFAACKVRGLPVITFANKADRPGIEPLGVLDDVERELGLQPVAVTWPVGCEGNLQEVVEVATAQASLAADPEDPDRARAAEELELLGAAQEPLDVARVLAGEQTPVLFGSAVQGVGVDRLLDAVREWAPAPGERPAREDGAAPVPVDGPPVLQVFKVQTGMDPRHRDQVAFLRVSAGRFERGVRLVDERTGKPATLQHAHEVFGRERRELDEAWPGDVVGVSGAGDLRVGDTLSPEGTVALPGIPAFAPEHFRSLRLTDVTRYKQFHRGLAQLDAEGVVQVLHDPAIGTQHPILGAVGVLQFEVAAERLGTEFNAPVVMEASSWGLGRLIAEEHVEVVSAARNAIVLRDARERAWAVFQREWDLKRFQGEHPDVPLHALVVG